MWKGNALILEGAGVGVLTLIDCCVLLRDQEKKQMTELCSVAMETRRNKKSDAWPRDHDQGCRRTIKRLGRKR